MLNSGLNQIANTRSKAVLKQQLLGDPLIVLPQDYDPTRQDTSAEHREMMRKKLYVPRIPYSYQSTRN